MLSIFWTVVLRITLVWEVTVVVVILWFSVIWDKDDVMFTFVFDDVVEVSEVVVDVIFSNEGFVVLSWMVVCVVWVILLCGTVVLTIDESVVLESSVVEPTTNETVEVTEADVVEISETVELTEVLDVWTVDDVEAVGTDVDVWTGLFELEAMLVAFDDIPVVVWTLLSIAVVVVVVVVIVVVEAPAKHVSVNSMSGISEI